MNKFSSILYLFALLFVSSVLHSQTTFETTTFQVKPMLNANIKNASPKYNFSIINLDQTFEGNKAYSEFIQEIKNKVSERFPQGKYFKENFKTMAVDTPIVLGGFEGNLYANSVPNDNSIAVSNDGKLISTINSNIYFYDIAGDSDTLLLATSLSAFSDTLDLNTSQYDPKLIYDPQLDRFVIVYLAGFLDSTSDIVVGFSQTNDPLGFWNMYSLPGNPLNDTSWSDFPAIALTKTDLYITVNLLKNDEDWQTAFKQSIIWQIPKTDGYNNNAVQAKLWHNIGFNGKPIRNINPVVGGSQLYGPDEYLLSTRNFSIQNDTIFLVHISGAGVDTNAQCVIHAIISDKSYGMPPKARQALGNTFETNDTRVLAAFIENGLIQFVGNTIDTITGFAAVYHGILSHLLSNPTIHATILGDSALDYGYPNISYTGKGLTDNSAIINFNHTSPVVVSGCSALFFDGNGGYSKRVNLKTGNTYVNILSGSYERWGDYSGSQRKFNEPGKVWLAGSYGKKVGTFNNRLNATWISEIRKPDDVAPEIPQYFELLSYPNPALDIVNLELSIPEKTKIEISLFDLSGKKVKSLYNGGIEAGTNVITFSTLPLGKGIYFVAVKESEKTILTRKIIVGK